MHAAERDLRLLGHAAGVRHPVRREGLDHALLARERVARHVEVERLLLELQLLGLRPLRDLGKPLPTGCPAGVPGAVRLGVAVDRVVLEITSSYENDAKQKLAAGYLMLTAP